MRNLITFSALIFLMALGDQIYAQSGSRGGGRSGGVSRGGGGGISGGVIRGAGSGSRLNRAQQERLFQQQQLYRQQQFAEAAQAQAQQSQQQREQALIHLAQPAGKSTNNKQAKAALNEAKKDFQRLRKKQITPDQLSALQTIFRLTPDQLDRSNLTAVWPSALQSDQFSESIEKLDQALTGNATTTASLTGEFLGELQALNLAINTAAVSGDIKKNDFAEARQFITGLANEVRSDVRSEESAE